MIAKSSVRWEQTSARTEVASQCSNILGESPVWSAREQALYWTDIREPALYRFDAERRSTRKWPMPELAGAVVLRESGGVVVGLQSGLYAFDTDTAALEPIHKFADAHPGDRTNDSRCDRQGRIWFSRMRDFGRAFTGAIYRMDRTLNPVPVISGLSVPNAICFSRAGDRLYLADTAKGALEMVDLDAQGTPLRRQLFAAPEVAPGKPDGATVDAEGYVWNARFGGSSLVRCTPDGRIDRIVDLPVSRPTSYSFGGRNLDQLYVTTATQGLDPAALAQEQFAGALLVLEPGVKGLEEPAFCY